MSSDTTPDNQPKTPAFPPARDAAAFRSLLTLLMGATAFVALGSAVGHALAPSLIAAPGAGLLRLTWFIAVAWFVFNALWALVNHLVTTTVHGVIQGYALIATNMLTAVAAYAQAQAQAETPVAPPATAPQPEGSVAYMTDFLKERLDALKNQKPVGDE